MIEEKRPDASYGDQTSSSPTRSVFYDALGRQVALKDALGHVNGQVWDAAGQLAAETHADGGRVTYAYNILGDRVQKIDALGNASGASDSTTLAHTTVYGYDRLHRLVSVRHGDADSGSIAVATLSGGLTLLQSIAYENLTESFGHDEAGRRKTSTNAAGETTTTWYDRAGNLIKTRTPGGHETSARFDAFDRKISETDADSSTATWGYTAFGQLNAHKDIGGATYGYTYDAAGQLTQQTNSRGQNLKYGYDAAGQRISIVDASAGTAVSAPAFRPAVAPSPSAASPSPCPGPRTVQASACQGCARACRSWRGSSQAR